MHLHLWDKLQEHLDDPVAEADLKPTDIYDDHIQWTGTIVVEGREYHVELRQPTKL